VGFVTALPGTNKSPPHTVVKQTNVTTKKVKRLQRKKKLCRGDSKSRAEKIGFSRGGARRWGGGVGKNECTNGPYKLLAKRETGEGTLKKRKIRGGEAEKATPQGERVLEGATVERGSVNVPKP